jgi:hypothetical protein
MISTNNGREIRDQEASVAKYYLKLMLGKHCAQQIHGHSSCVPSRSEARALCNDSIKKLITALFSVDSVFKNM